MSPRLQLACALTLTLLGCGSVTLGPDGGTGRGGADGGTTGVAGHGTAGTTGQAGSSGTAGTTGGAGSTGTAGTTGLGGSTGTAGTGGHAGTGGCAAIACGDVFCPYGFKLDANGCSTCSCNPAPACTMTECGGPPPFAQPMCPNGQIIGPMCVRSADGKCGWQAPRCLVVCPAIACPAIFCPNGNATDPNGCPTCACNPGPTCPPGSHAVTCSGVMCALACSDGFKRGTDGCPLCACRAPATCTPMGGACISCPFGYRKGPNGCATCACDDPPLGCAP